MDSYYRDDNLVNSVMNLFGAGTTGNTIRSGLLLMAKYPHIQGIDKHIYPDDRYRYEHTSDV